VRTHDRQVIEATSTRWSRTHSCHW
jgi:hypothetical protein